MPVSGSNKTYQESWESSLWSGGLDFWASPDSTYYDCIWRLEKWSLQWFGLRNPSKTVALETRRRRRGWEWEMQLKQGPLSRQSLHHHLLLSSTYCYVDKKYRVNFKKNWTHFFKEPRKWMEGLLCHKVKLSTW